jgi:2-octaprenylphenol hydroxylase
MNPKNPPHYDITIIGSGIVGATAALALSQNPSLNIAVIEEKNLFTLSSFASRVSALALSSKYIFENIHTWESIRSKPISAYKEMHVWDQQEKSKLIFKAEALQEEALGYIVEDDILRTSLLERFKEHANLTLLCPLKIISLTQHSDHIVLKTNNDELIKTSLLIAADGAESWTRRELGIELKTWDYQHTAIIATVETELPHRAVARQCFLPTGPLAFLPLPNPHQCSIVWSVTPDKAAALLDLNDITFCKTLAEAFEYQLGAITSSTARQWFPLKMRHAKQYVGERFALIGDAAHTVHPLAGQGVNLGLLDAVTLAEVVNEAHRKQRDFASHATLRRYERRRKSDTIAMIGMVEFLKRLFAVENTSVKYVRNMGLRLTNRLSPFKNAIANYAVGKRNDLPRIANMGYSHP